MAKVLYFDCFSGASGDMILGALIDAGLPIEELRSVLGSLSLGDVQVEARRVERSGIGATSFNVIDDQRHRNDSQGKSLEPSASKAQHDRLRRGAHQHHDDGHRHDGPQHQHHRSLSEILDMVSGSALSPHAKERANGLFSRLAEVEAAIHQVPVEQVQLHEVGAVDSIIDIAGCVFGLEWLNPDKIIASPLNVGSGTVKCEHGVMPVPAPATTRLIEGVPAYSKGPAAELLTPTGALVVTEYAESYGPMPPMRIRQTGYGAGKRDFPDHPNLLRVLVGDHERSSCLQRVVVFECEIDDMNPQIFGAMMVRLHEAGALDVFYTPIQMKKNRPGTLVTVVALPTHREVISDLLFRETTTIGVRFREMDRERLDREQIEVDTPLGMVRFKLARRVGGQTILNAAPEFDDCARLAERHELSVKEVQAVAMKCYLERHPNS